MTPPKEVQEYIDLIVVNYHQDDEPECRRRMGSLWDKIAAANPSAGFLQLLMEFAAADVWGGCALLLDGDCFEPPPWRCILTGSPFCKNEGMGNTPEEAISAALKAKAANPGKPEGSGSRPTNWGLDGE
jgi:hypothetical protein